MCRSWPQACMVPGTAGAYSSPVSSVTGRASMSPRSSTTGRRAPSGSGAPPRSTTTTELSARPTLVSSAGRPVAASSPASARRASSRSRTAAWVRGRCRSSSGCPWRRRRKAIASRAMSSGRSGARAFAGGVGAVRSIKTSCRGGPPAHPDRAAGQPASSCSSARSKTSSLAGASGASTAFHSVKVASAAGRRRSRRCAVPVQVSRRWCRPRRSAPPGSASPPGTHPRHGRRPSTRSPTAAAGPRRARP